MQKPITLGKLAQQDDTLRIDETIFEKNLVICAEKLENICTFTNNCVAQLSDKVVVIDTDHTFTEYKSISFKKNFKLPLNAKMIDYIYENDLEGVSPTSKAVIQEIFQEVREYAKTTTNNFIPFDTFVDVVSAQYEETNIPELALLKQKLLKYREENIFAQTSEDIFALKKAVLANNLTYIDLTDTTDTLQKELIEFIHEELDKIDSYLYCFVKLTNKNSDKKLLRALLDNNHIFTTITCSHNYKYVHELKQKAENIVLFAPQTIQHDFASYNTFLSKLNINEFVVYGALTQNVPFLVELSELSQDEIGKKQEEISVETKIEIPESTEIINNPFEPNMPIVQEEVNNIFEENSFEDNFLNTTQIESTENLLADDVDLFEETSTTIEEPHKKIEEDLRFDDELIEQVAKDVDKIYYTAPKNEVLPEIEDFSTATEEQLTENDLDLIEELPLDVPMEEATIEELPTEDFSDLEETSEDIEILEELIETEQEELGFTPDTMDLSDVIDEAKEEPLPTLEDVLGQSEDTDETAIFEESAELEEDNLPEIEEPVEELPIYETEEVTQPAIEFAQGDTVTHPKYGTGVVEKLIKYGNKTLCSISFEEVGRRLLDPSISELQKVI